MALTQHMAPARPAYFGGFDAEPRQLRFQLPAQGASVAIARRNVRTRLTLWGCHEDLCETAQLVLSELFTNALVHSRSEHIRCALQAPEKQLLYIEVTDQGGGLIGPTPRQAGVEDENGRGLALVRALAEAWGDRPIAAGGRSVWAQLRGAGS